MTDPYELDTLRRIFHMGFTCIQIHGRHIDFFLPKDNHYEKYHKYSNTVISRMIYIGIRRIRLII